MSRQAWILIFGLLVLVPSAVKAELPTPLKVAEPNHNQVYVKIIMPIAPADWNKDRIAVETWIADDLKKLGQARFTAVTKWVPLDLSPHEATHLWDGALEKQQFCPVCGDVSDRAKSHIKVTASGWSPGGAHVNISLRDEPGSRGLMAVKDCKTEQGTPYVAVLVGPPSEKSAAPHNDKK